jgi:hypothetical protein
MELVAQFDYRGTSIADHLGLVNPDPRCAPELGLRAECRPAFDSVAAGERYEVSVEVPLVGEIVQTRPGGRAIVGGRAAHLLAADTLRLDDSGVPFAWTDATVRNGLRYYYAVTAFDVNSARSAPASFESSRVLKSVRPERRATNVTTEVATSVAILGRSGPLDSTAPQPTIDPQTGRFSGPMPPADAMTFKLPGELVPEIVQGAGEVVLTLDSIDPGNPYGSSLGLDPEPTVYHFTSTGPAGTVRLQVPLTQSFLSATARAESHAGSLPASPGEVARYGGAANHAFPLRLTLELPGNYYTSVYGRGCINGADGFTASSSSRCSYNGARWFDGPSPARNEVRANPTAGQGPNNINGDMGGMQPADNAGALSGVSFLYEARAYQTVQTTWRAVEGALGGVARAADFNVHWGENGAIDSVVDVTHDVLVPFSERLGASWGILNQAAAAAPGAFDERPDVLTITDLGCVEPLRANPAVQALVPCAAAAPYRLSRQAAPGTVARLGGMVASVRTTPASAQQGFVIYLPGHFFHVELAAGLPAKGAVWTLRSYVGAISGGRGDPVAGDEGDYVFTSSARPLTAVGARLRFSYSASARIETVAGADLERVHTVPDPYYGEAELAAGRSESIRFVNLPQRANIRIYSASGVLVTILEHDSQVFGGTAEWNLRSRNGKRVASGVYFYHLESGDARRVGRLTVINAREVE